MWPRKFFYTETSGLRLNPVEMPLPQSTSDANLRPRWRLVVSQAFETATFWEVVSLFAFMLFFLLYGVTPLLGGAGMGLVGADEPRYAQIAHEMLQKLNHAHTLREQLSAYVTPYLYGRPWLEKPALYYWRAMYVFREFGVSDWAARLQIPETEFPELAGARHLWA